MQKINLKQIRKSNGLTQSQMADKLGITQASYSRIESGKTSISFDVEEALKKEFDVEIDINDIPKRSVPFYNIDVYGTAAPIMEDIKALEPEYFITIPFFKGCDFAVRMKGKSMYPLYRPGDVMVCKRITNKQFIVYGEAYLIITKSDNLRTVKFLQEDLNDNTCLIMAPYNREQFNPQSLPKNEILELFEVKGTISDS